MALSFDITGAPPPQADIAAERERIAKERAALRKKDIRYMAGGVVMVLSVLAFQLLVIVPQLKDDSPHPGLVGLFVFYVPYLFGAMFFGSLTLYSMKIEKPGRLLKAALAAVEEVTPDETSEVIGPEPSPMEIAAYQEKVATLGRPLVRGELDAIQRWLDKHRPAA